MDFPLEISFENLAPSNALEARIRTLAARFKGGTPRIARCEVVLEQTHSPHPHGNLCRVGLVLDVSVDDAGNTHRLSAGHAHVDVQAALRDAFEALQREVNLYRECHRV